MKPELGKGTPQSTRLSSQCLSGRFLPVFFLGQFLLAIFSFEENVIRITDLTLPLSAEAIKVDGVFLFSVLNRFKKRKDCFGLDSAKCVLPCRQFGMGEIGNGMQGLKAVNEPFEVDVDLVDGVEDIRFDWQQFGWRYL